jgi:hexosaminidase
VQKIVSKHGKTMVGWDEILRPDLPKDIVVQSWRGQDSLAAAAQQGYRGILSFGYYVDLMWPASRHYAVDPISAAANLSPDEKRLILGGEACMWSEYVSPENIDSRIWPRTAAIAERLWSPQDVTEVNSMYQRLENVSRWLDWLGLTHNSSYGPMLRRIAGTNDISVLRTFTDVVEPVKDYNREELAVVEATSLSPLNRVIDATRPESMTARRFGNLVDALIGGHADSEAKQEVRASLIRWRDNQSNLQPLESQSFLLTEIVPLSQDLTAVATTGLQALDYLDRGERAPDAWATQQFAFLEQARKPKAQLLLMVVPSVQKLVAASSGQKAPPPPLEK